MPVIKSSVKDAKKNLKNQARNQHFKSLMKTMIKKTLQTAHKDKKKAAALLPMTMSAIDKACKKKIIHKNTAARRKSLVARALI